MEPAAHRADQTAHQDPKRKAITGPDNNRSALWRGWEGACSMSMPAFWAFALLGQGGVPLFSTPPSCLQARPCPGPLLSQDGENAVFCHFPCAKPGCGNCRCIPAFSPASTPTLWAPASGKGEKPYKALDFFLMCSLETGENAAFSIFLSKTPGISDGCLFVTPQSSAVRNGRWSHLSHRIVG